MNIHKDPIRPERITVRTSSDMRVGNINLPPSPSPAFLEDRIVPPMLGGKVTPIGSMRYEESRCTSSLHKVAVLRGGR